MEKIVSNQQKTLKGRVPILILSILALAINIVGGLYFRHVRESVFISLVSIHTYPLTWNLYIVACGLLFLFALWFYRFSKASHIAMCIFGILVFSDLIDVSFGGYIFYNQFTTYFFIVRLFSYITMGITIITDKKKKLCFILTFILGAVLQMLFAMGVLTKVLFPEELPFYIFERNLTQLIATDILLVALFLLVRNKFVSLKRSYAIPAKNESLSPADELRALKADFENGIITAEEYAEKRAEIINNL